RMLGDGLAIDPTSDVLHAPCDGVIAHLAATGHAVSLRTQEGAEVLMHIGLETVALAGKGFSPFVTAGEAVTTGQALIRFDMDRLASQAKSLLTPIVITNGGAFSLTWRAADGPTE